MSDPVQAPWVIRWLAEILFTLPAPTNSWAAIIGSLAWPAVVLFLVIRFRRFISRFLWVIADRLERDHVKFGWFEIRANDQVTVLDPDESSESTLEFDPLDIERIERIFEFIADAANYDRLVQWLNKTYGNTLDIEDFLTLPEYASERERAFEEVEGLAK